MTSSSAASTPEDDHHPDCSAIPEQVITALGMDREMRNEVGLLNFDDLAHKPYWQYFINFIYAKALVLFLRGQLY